MNNMTKPSSINASNNSKSTALIIEKLDIPRKAKIVLEMLNMTQGGTIATTLPDGTQMLLGEGASRVQLNIRDWSVFSNLLNKKGLGFGEDYMNGLWHSDTLRELLILIANNRAQFAGIVIGNKLRLVAYRLWHLLRTNTRLTSRRNIEAHYDLGNDFYALWLDESMTYSSALYSQADMTLAEAQYAKYQRILQKLGVQAGDHILEIGCGWGGFAEVATQEYGCRVTGLTLSPSQLKWAQQRARDKHFDELATFCLRDYRDEHGQYDHIVSIEMVEAVGARYWPHYFNTLHRCLKPKGKILIQAITIDEKNFQGYRAAPDFIQHYIFPGGILPTHAIINEQANNAKLQIAESFNFGIDYAQTLKVWYEQFMAQTQSVREQGFNERFVRMWEFYLAYCEAGFRARSIDVAQYELTHSLTV